MPYTKNDPPWNPGGAPGISAKRLSHMETQYDEARADLNAHKAASPIDHPDGSVTDAKIGNRTPDQTQVPASPGTGLLGKLLSWFANRIKVIMGTTNWWNDPPINLAQVDAHVKDRDNPHNTTRQQLGAAAASDLLALQNSYASHTGNTSAHHTRYTDAEAVAAVKAADGSGSDIDADTVDGWHRDEIRAWANITGKPATFAPSSHKHPGSDITSRVNDSDKVDGWHADSLRAWANITGKPTNFAYTPVPVTALKRAQGSSSSSAFNVHQYAFLSVQTSGNAGLFDYQRGAVVAGYRPGDDTATRRMMATIRSGSSSTGRIADWNIGTITWDYLTASGHPKIWASVDDRGEIQAMWEAEDPVDPEEPDEPPIEAGEGLILVPVLDLPGQRELTKVLDGAVPNAKPRLLGKGIYKTAKTPQDLYRAIVKRELDARGLEEPPDPRDIYQIKDHDRRMWYLQLYLRGASRTLHDHKNNTLIPLLQERYRVDPGKRKLVTK